MKLFVVLLIAFSCKTAWSRVSQNCMIQIRSAANCALGPIENCFTRNGCVMPDGPPRNGRRPPQSNGRCGCIKDLMDRAKPTLEQCFMQEFPGIPQKFIRMLKHSMDSLPRGMCPDELRDHARSRMQERIQESCAGGGDAAAVMRCLQTQKRGGGSRVRECIRSNIDEQCQQEVLQSTCVCIDELLERDRSFIEDGIQCARTSGALSRLPAPMQGMIRPELVRGMLDRVCRSGRGLDIIRSVANLMRQRAGSRGGGGFRGFS